MTTKNSLMNDFPQFDENHPDFDTDAMPHPTLEEFHDALELLLHDGMDDPMPFYKGDKKGEGRFSGYVDCFKEIVELKEDYESEGEHEARANRLECYIEEQQEEIKDLKDPEKHAGMMDDYIENYLKEEGIDMSLTELVDDYKKLKEVLGDGGIAKEEPNKKVKRLEREMKHIDKELTYTRWKIWADECENTGVYGENEMSLCYDDFMGLPL